MEFLKRLTEVQIGILLIIGGITSLIALDGLSHIYEDYYVSAAISRAFFSAILMLIVFSPLLYFFRNRKNEK